MIGTGSDSCDAFSEDQSLIFVSFDISKNKTKIKDIFTF